MYLTKEKHVDVSTFDMATTSINFGSFLKRVGPNLSNMVILFC